MLSFEFFEELVGGANASLLYVLNPWPDAFGSVGGRGDIEQALVGFRILDNRGSPAVYRAQPAACSS